MVPIRWIRGQRRNLRNAYSRNGWKIGDWKEYERETGPRIRIYGFGMRLSQKGTDTKREQKRKVTWDFDQLNKRKRKRKGLGPYIDGRNKPTKKGGKLTSFYFGSSIKNHFSFHVWSGQHARNLPINFRQVINHSKSSYLDKDQYNRYE